MPGERIAFELVVGLGNPGSEYAATRHNAGFWFAEAFGRGRGATFSNDRRFFAVTGSVMVGGRKIHVAMPSAYMNRSGQGVAAVARFYKIDPERILIAHDELDLPPGEIRLKRGGGHGGHNGLRDIVPKLGSSDFWRLRIGIGHPGHKSAVSGYVLKRAPAEQQRLIEEAVELALGEAETLVDGDVNVAMKAINGHRPGAS